MGAGDIALNILITAQDNASASLNNLATQVLTGGVKSSAEAAAGALIGFGVASVQAAGSFQSGMTTLVTGAGESESALGMVSQGILSLSTSTGTSVQQLTAGMFMIESAGYHGAAGLQVLQVAAEGAKVGNADLGTVANAVTTILTDYHMSGDQAAQAMNGLTATVQSGKTNMQDLAGSMGSVLPLASSLGISFPQVAGALAVMTNSGMNAQRASMNLANAMRSLAAPGATAQKALKGVDISTTQLNDVLTHQGLQAALQMIEDHVGKKFPQGSSQWTAAMKAIMGGATGLNVALMLGGQNMSAYEANIAKITAAMSPAQKAVIGWSNVQQDFNFKLDQAKQAFSVLMIVIGSALLPVLGNILSALTPLITGFSNLIAGSGQLSPELQNVAGMFGIMGTNWGQFIAQLQSTLSGPLAQFGQLMGSLLPGFLTQFLRALNLVQLGFMAVAGPLSAILVPALKILGQVFQGIQQALEPILNALEGQFIPAVQNLASAIAPVIASFLQWVADSGIVTTVLSALGTVISIVITVISFLMNVLAAIIVFFSQTAVGAALFKAILIVLAVVIGAIGLVILAVVIPAFIAWVAGAIAVGIANIIAFAPIILIILAIVAVVAIVILIIQNWGAIVGWLGGVWNAFTSWFMGALSAIGAFFQGIWNGMVTFLQGVWNRIVATVTMYVMLVEVRLQQTWQNILSTAQGIWNNLVAFFQGIWNTIVNAVQTAINTVVGWFVWLYNHNYYFKDLVDFIVNVITFVVNWLQTTWQNIVNWISGEWNYLTTLATMYWMLLQVIIQTKIQQVVTWLQGIWTSIITWIGGQWNYLTTLATMYWNMLVVIIQSKIDQAWAYLQGIWNNVVTFLQGIWNNITTQVTTAWNNISSIFAGAWNNYIAGPLGGLWNSISGWFGNLASTAATWGKNLIQGFINGILGMLGNVGNAVQQILGKVGNLLGFHSPTKEGEGQHIVEWGQNMVKGFGQGIAAATPMLHAQIEHLIQPPKLSYAKAAGSAFALSTSPVVHVHIEPGEAHVHLDKQKVGHAVMNFAAKEIRTQGGIRR